MENTQTVNKMPNSRQPTPMRETEPVELGRDFVHYLREYARENPGTAALWCFGIGFVLGWKLKLW
jgi:hypothetical protein